MSENNCGCKANTPKEFLMVEATASESSTCGIPSSSTIADCVKQEPMYDISKSDFLVPSKESSTSVDVCNPDIYSIGMWLEFIDPVVTLKISNITGKILTLINRFPDGSIVENNPDAGQVVRKGTKFVVCCAPESLSDEENLENIAKALAIAEELVMPDLKQSSTEAIIHPVGRVYSDPTNLGAKKGIRRIFGFLFKGGTPVLSSLLLVPGASAAGYRRLVKHKTSNEVRHLANYHEYPGMAPDRQYMLGITKEAETLVGPAYAFYPFHNSVHENTASLEPADWPDLDLTYENDFDISGVAQIDGLGGTLDHYFVLVRIEVGIRSASDNVTKIQLNGLSAGRVYSGKSDSEYNLQFNSISIPIKVMRSDNKIIVRIVARETSKFYFRLNLDGVMF